MGDHFNDNNVSEGSYLIPDKAYDILKWVALILLPALALLINTIGPEWGMSNVKPIVITMDAIGLFIGSCIGVSQMAKR